MFCNADQPASEAQNIDQIPVSSRSKTGVQQRAASFL
jgi:hypothetical protein